MYLNWRKGLIGALLLSPIPVMAQAGYSVTPSSVVVPSSAMKQLALRSASQDSVTLTVKDSSVAYVVTTLVHQAHLRLVYKYSDPAFTKRISVHIVNQDIMSALAVALKGTGLAAERAADGETILIHDAKAAAASSQTQTGNGVISGSVVDSSTGHAVEDATVAVQGTVLSGLTDQAGKFVLRNVPAGTQLLTVKLFGYKPGAQTVAVREDGRVTVGFVLTPVATVLSGVVTTATGQQQKLAVGSDITTINVDSVMKIAPISSVTDLLENRVPGLTTLHTMGTPGDPSRLLLRGAASVTGNNNPIVVVDGVRVYYPQSLGDVQQQKNPGFAGSGDFRPSPLDQIDPNTIETIEVLKGPSASALYGSDAANGVIVITTKKGSPGETRWSVTAEQGISALPGGFPSITYAYGHQLQYQDVSTGALTINDQLSSRCQGGLLYTKSTFEKAGTPCILDSVRTFNAFDDPRFTPLTSGPMSSASVTVSGGAQALTYSFTGSAQNTHGITKLPTVTEQQYTDIMGSAPPSWMVHPDDYLMWNGSGQMTAALSSRATITVSDMLSNSTQHRTNQGTYIVADLLGAYIDTSNTFNIPGFSDYLTRVTNATLTSTTNATLQWQIRPWLPLAITAGLNRSQETDKQYLPAGLPASLLLINAGDSTGYYDLGTSNVSLATINANTTIPVSWWQNRGLQFAVGLNFVNQSSALQDISTTNVPVGVSDPTTFVQTSATTVTQLSQSAATYGWFFEPQLHVGSRLYITPGLRFDGGTASGSNAGYTVFPKTNLSYIAIDHTNAEDDAPWAQVLTLLRLRGALGVAGVQPAPGQNLRLFTAPQAGSLDGGTVVTTQTVLHTLGNTTLHPERSREFEAGVDAQLFQNRVSFTATYYNKLRIDAIESIPVAPSVIGITATTSYLNIGNIRNDGLELTANARLLDRGGVAWDVNGLMSSNQNKVLSTAAGYTSTCNLAQWGFTTTCARAGYPLGAVFAPRVVGYADLNGDGLIEASEIQFSDSAQYVGVADPRYTASFGTTVSLWTGRLSLSTQGDYQNGLTLRNSFSNALFASAANAADADQLTQVLSTATAVNGQSATALQTINTLRWDALSVTYTLPASVSRFFHGQQASVALQGSNLGLITNYHGKDPDVNILENGLGAYDTGLLPQPRTWRLAVRVTQ